MVYCCKISKDCEVLKRAFSLCHENRQKKAERLKSVDAKAVSITAGLLLKYCLLLSGHDDCEVRYDENGKPCLENGELYFSLSHSGGYAACVVGDKPNGIDIQRIIDINERTVRRYSTEREREMINQSSDPNVAAVTVWALKESYLKASGCSTSEAFAAEFDISGGAVKGPEGYVFELSFDMEGYVLAVCREI